MSQEGIIDAGTERLIDEAQQIGERAGLQSSFAAAAVLRQAYAKSIADMINFGDDPQRLRLAIETIQAQLIDDVKLQAFLRQGRRGRPT